eukprot:gene7291-407_t
MHDTHAHHHEGEHSTAQTLEAGLMNMPANRTEHQVEALCEWLGSLFPLPVDQLRDVVQSSHGSFYREGQTVFRAGETCDYFYVVNHGTINISDIKDRETGETHDPTLRVLDSGHYWGDEEIISGCRLPYSAHARLDGTLILKIPITAYKNNLAALQEPSFKEKVAFLHSLAPFRALREDVVRRLTPCFQLLEFKQKDLLVRQGEAADSMYAIKEGKCIVIVDPELKADDEVVPKDKKKNEPVVTLDQGAIIGDITVLSTVKRRTASVIASLDVVCFRIRRAVFLRHLPSEELETLRRLATEKLHLTDNKVSRRMGLGSMHEQILHGHNLRTLYQQEKAESKRHPKSVKMRVLGGIDSKPKMERTKSYKRMGSRMHKAAMVAAGIVELEDEEETIHGPAASLRYSKSNKSVSHSRPPVPPLSLSGLCHEAQEQAVAHALAMHHANSIKEDEESDHSDPESPDNPKDYTPFPAPTHPGPSPAQHESPPHQLPPPDAPLAGSQPMTLTLPAPPIPEPSISPPRQRPQHRAASSRPVARTFDAGPPHFSPTPAKRSSSGMRASGALTLSPFSNLTVSSRPNPHLSSSSVEQTPLASLVSNHLSHLSTKSSTHKGPHRGRGSASLRDSMSHHAGVTEASLQFKSQVTAESLWPPSYMPPGKPAMVPPTNQNFMVMRDSWNLHRLPAQQQQPSASSSNRQQAPTILPQEPQPPAPESGVLAAETSSSSLLWEKDSPRFSLRTATEHPPRGSTLDPCSSSRGGKNAQWGICNAEDNLPPPPEPTYDCSPEAAFRIPYGVPAKALMSSLSDTGCLAQGKGLRAQSQPLLTRSGVPRAATAGDLVVPASSQARHGWTLHFRVRNAVEQPKRPFQARGLRCTAAGA